MPGELPLTEFRRRIPSSLRVLHSHLEVLPPHLSGDLGHFLPQIMDVCSTARNDKQSEVDWSIRVVVSIRLLSLLDRRRNHEVRREMCLDLLTLLRIHTNTPLAPAAV